MMRIYIPYFDVHVIISLIPKPDMYLKNLSQLAVYDTFSQSKWHDHKSTYTI